MPQSTDTRTKLLAAAERILMEQGLTGVSVRKVGEAAGVNPALVAYHFHGIDGLLEQLCHHNLAAITHDWSVVDPAATPPQDLDTVLSAWIEPMQKPAVFTGSGRTIDVLDEIVAHGSQQLRDSLLQELYRFTEILDAVLAPYCPKLGTEERRIRMRFIAGAVLGPPPRGFVRRSENNNLPIDHISYLLPFARAALEA